MSEAVQVTLIVSGTIIFLCILSFLFIKNIFNKEFYNAKDAISKVKRDTERFGYCKSPTYPRPPIPGSRKKFIYDSNTLFKRK